jgi:hypothetical protein
MNRFLQAIYSKDHHYMPYTMKKNFPKAVAAAILAQNKLIKNTWVIVLVGIHRNVMPKIENNHIRASPGVTGISETNRTDQNGRWNILVHKNNFKSIRKLLTKNIQDWVSNVTPAIQATIPDTFPAPKVYQKNSYNDDDDDSSFGQASYMSSCAQSYASFDNDMDEQFFNPPGKYNSYASALSSTIPTPTGTDVLIPDKRRAVPEAPASPLVAQANATRIDYALLSPDLVGAVQLCGYEPFQQRIKSDHRGLYIDFNTSMLFGNDTQTLGPAALRDFTAKYPANNSTYISAKHAHLTQQGFFGHLARLHSIPNGDHALAERLDANLQISSAAAGNKVKRFYKPWWSQSLTKARAVVDILQRQLSGFKTNTSIRTVLVDRILDLSLDLVLPVTKSDCQDLLATKIITL